MPRDIAQLVEQVHEEESQIDESQDAGAPEEGLILFYEEATLEKNEPVVDARIVHHEECNCADPVKPHYVAGSSPDLKLDFVVVEALQLRHINLAEDYDRTKSNQQKRKNKSRQPDSFVAHLGELGRVDCDFLADKGFQLLATVDPFRLLEAVVLHVKLPNGLLDFLDLNFQLLKPD